jgi:hypothetical protein
MMWLKLGGVWLATALFAGLLLMPVQIHTVKLDMPTAVSPGSVASPPNISNTVDITLGILAVWIVLPILAVPFLLSWQIVRKHKKSS